MRQSGPGVGFFIVLAVVGSAAAVVLAAWLGNWGGWNPRYDSFTHDGVRISEVGPSLAAAEEAWIQTHESWVESGDAVAAPADTDSRCYLQVWPTGDVADVGLCGPFVRAEGEDPEWASFEWYYETFADGTVRIDPQEMRPRVASELFVEPSTHDEIGASGEALFFADSDLVSADGGVVDRARAVTPPLGWPRTIDAWEPVGEVLSMPRDQIVASGVVHLYGHDYRVEVDSLAQLKLSGERTYVPAPGGGIVDFRITPDEPAGRAARTALDRATGLADAVAGPDRNAAIRITCEVRSGQETLTDLYAESMPLLRGVASQQSDVAPPSALLVIPRLEDATYAIVVNGIRHPVS